MTKKQMRKLAHDIYEQNIIHDDPQSSSEDKARAEKRIISLTQQILTSPRGIEVLEEVDAMIQEIINKNKETI